MTAREPDARPTAAGGRRGAGPDRGRRRGHVPAGRGPCGRRHAGAASADPGRPGGPAAEPLRCPAACAVARSRARARRSPPRRQRGLDRRPSSPSSRCSIGGAAVAGVFTSDSGRTPAAVSDDLPAARCSSRCSSCRTRCRGEVSRSTRAAVGAVLALALAGVLLADRRAAGRRRRPHRLGERGPGRADRRRRRPGHHPRRAAALRRSAARRPTSSCATRRLLGEADLLERRAEPEPSPPPSPGARAAAAAERRSPPPSPSPEPPGAAAHARAVAVPSPSEQPPRAELA